MPEATLEDVRGELPESADFDDSRIQTFIGRGSKVVRDRISVDSESDLDHIADLEALVSAHFAYPHMTDAVKGRAVSSVSKGSASISYKDSRGPEGHSSPYWMQAVMLDDRLKTLGESDGRTSATML